LHCNKSLSNSDVDNGGAELDIVRSDCYEFHDVRSSAPVIQIGFRHFFTVWDRETRSRLFWVENKSCWGGAFMHSHYNRHQLPSGSHRKYV
jgi:hypothetical protein